MSELISLRRLLSVAAVSAFSIAVMLGLASSASAATTTTSACAFVGAAGPIDPGPEGIVSDVMPIGSNPLDTDSGTYQFNTLNDTAACAGLTGGAPFAAIGNIHSSGSYTNSLCGTGIVDGNDAGTTVIRDQTLPALGAPPDVTSVNYSLVFTAGEGPLTINGATLANGESGLTGLGPNNEAGWVSIVPTTPGPSQANPTQLPTACTLDRATAFDVQGAFVVSNVL